ncbi:hotdog domain-containing protein [Leucobacter musarum]|uniref:hotdog domain-containing protein n=1 Tax=Leucobacter musarum TaxID=1930747 RepID=UPI0006A75EDC|nr:hotdog domain-containing protein [Leucobacter musarum]
MTLRNARVSGLDIVRRIVDADAQLMYLPRSQAYTLRELEAGVVVIEVAPLRDDSRAPVLTSNVLPIAMLDGVSALAARSAAPANRTFGALESRFNFLRDFDSTDAHILEARVTRIDARSMEIDAVIQNRSGKDIIRSRSTGSVHTMREPVEYELNPNGWVPYPHLRPRGTGADAAGLRSARTAPAASHRNRTH